MRDSAGVDNGFRQPQVRGYSGLLDFDFVQADATVQLPSRKT